MPALNIQLDNIAVALGPSLPVSRDLKSLDHLIIVTPVRVKSELWRRLPLGNQLKLLSRRAGKPKSGRWISTRLNNDRATGVSFGRLSAGDGSYEGLTAARNGLAAAVLEGSRKIGILLAGFSDSDSRALARWFIEAADAAAFKLPRYPESTEAIKLRRLVVMGPSELPDIARLQAAGRGNRLARWLTAQPPNMLTAESFRKLAIKLARDAGAKASFLNEAALKKEGAGAFLAVAQGNATQDAGIVKLSYRPNGSAPPQLALVGKGIIFDTGGTNLKPFKSMLHMHQDMQGAAVALGAFLALVENKVPFAMDAWLALTENRISAKAYKPQDVVTAANGKTIQVIHTDAEGRMALADTLALASAASPALIVDFATLTGSCLQALGTRYSGLFSNDERLYEAFMQSGRACGERVWGFPMTPDYDSALKSDTADIKQCSESAYADHILAARFLSKFVADGIPWAHIDLSAGDNKGGFAHIPTEVTGFGVRLMVELFAERNPAELVAAL